LLINAQFRLVYPFLPAIARGLGVPLETAALLVAFRAALGAISPLFGLLADRIGRKPLMVTGVTALVLGAAVVASGQRFGVVLLGFGLLGIAQSAYDPAMQAHVSDAVPQERRGRALGIVELSWAGSWLIGVPVAGFLMARWGWQAPFVVVAVLGLLCILLTLTIKEVILPHLHCVARSAAQVSTAPLRGSALGTIPRGQDARLPAVVLPRPVIFALAAVIGFVCQRDPLLVYGALWRKASA
jgi:predicted MFS family arabinose efflux permease